jgi:hypothetical protein
MNSTLGSVVPLAMFFLIIQPEMKTVVRKSSMSINQAGRNIGLFCQYFGCGWAVCEVPTTNSSSKSRELINSAALSWTLGNFI